MANTAIYKITNLINHKVYIGQSIHPDRRWVEHCSKANTHSDNLPIHNAIFKYKRENFQFEILEWCNNPDQQEAYWITQCNSLVPNGYNILDGSSHNPVMYGENHPRNTLTDKQVSEIIRLLQEKIKTDVDIAKIVGTTTKIVADINHGITHRQEGITYPIRLKKGRTGGLSMEIRLSIIKDLQETTLSYAQLAKKYNVSKGLIGHINHGRYNQIPGIQYPIRRM